MKDPRTPVDKLVDAARRYKKTVRAVSELEASQVEKDKALLELVSAALKLDERDR